MNVAANWPEEVGVQRAVLTQHVLAESRMGDSGIWRTLEVGRGFRTTLRKI